MSCSPFDLRDYFLEELPDPERRQMEAHIKSCQPCREELGRLKMTQAALFSLPDEEIPQRIAFVSDKIFEPSPWRRSWGAFWGSAGRLGFAASAMLSAAIVFSAATRPAPAPAARVVTTTAALSGADMQTRIDAAVGRALAAMETRQAEKINQVVADLESTRQRLLMAAAEYDISQRRANTLRISAENYAMPRENHGGAK